MPKYLPFCESAKKGRASPDDLCRGSAKAEEATHA